MPIAPMEVLELAVRAVINNHEHVNTFHFRSKTGGEDVVMQTLAEDFRDNMLTPYVAGKSNALNVHTISVRAVEQTPQRGHDLNLVPWRAGTLAVPAAAPQLAMCISWRTATLGRASRGRSFLGGWGDEAELSGNWSEAAVNSAKAFAEAMLARYRVGLATTAFDFGIFNRPLPARQGVRRTIDANGVRGTAVYTLPPRPRDFKGILAYRVDGRARTQRRRALGTGS